MKVFWVIICCALLAVFFALWVSMRIQAETPRSEQLSSPALTVLKCFVTSSLVVIVWAICFRRQLEKRQFSLIALGALVAMEALLFGAIRLLGTLGP